MKRKKGSNPLARIATSGGNAKTGMVRTPRKVQVTDRRIKTGGIHGRKETAITEFAQTRHEFDYREHAERFANRERKVTPVRVEPTTRLAGKVNPLAPISNGAANAVRIAQLPKGTKPVWR